MKIRISFNRFAATSQILNRVQDDHAESTSHPNESQYQNDRAEPPSHPDESQDPHKLEP